MSSRENDDSKVIEEVEIGIQYSPTVADIGPLISAYGDEPERLASASGYRGYREENEVEISIKRTHEWEHVIVLTAIGAGTFAASVLKTLGKRTGDWIANQVEQQNAQSVRIKFENGETVNISQTEAKESRVNRFVVEKFEDASEKDEKLIIEFE